MKKTLFIIIALAIFFSSINLIYAIDLQVNEVAVSNTVISDLDKPAIFNLIIKNLGETENFTIYSLVGVDITPNTPIRILSEETKTIEIFVMPRDTLKQRQESIPFEYQIRNSKNEIQKETLIINVLSLENAFMITPYSINPQSDKLTVEIKNIANFDFNDLNIKFSSAFFEDYQSIYPLKFYETRLIEIPIDKDKLKTLSAGQFILNINLETNQKNIRKEAIIKFVEHPNIETKEINEGIIINKKEIIKKNIGNIKETATITIEKSFFSYFFTTVNPLPAKSHYRGTTRIYVWDKDLLPNEELKVIVTTNWLFPIFIVILIIVLFYIIKKSIERDLSFRKNVSYVKTKGGEFALRVTIHLKAKKFIEKINIIDKLPQIVNLYEKFGAVAPDKVDMHNKRLEWNIEAMNAGEERVFSYIIYSHKVGVVGRFELPGARIVYEKNNKIKEITSNRAFFINEPKHGM